MAYCVRALFLQSQVAQAHLCNKLLIKSHQGSTKVERGLCLLSAYTFPVYVAASLSRVSKYQKMHLQLAQCTHVETKQDDRQNE